MMNTKLFTLSKHQQTTAMWSRGAAFVTIIPGNHRVREGYSCA